MNTTLQDVTVKVPMGRVADFYEMYGCWLRGEQLEAEISEDTNEESWRDRPSWDPTADLDLAKTAWAQFPDRAKQLFGTLIDHPAKRYTGDELAILHGIPNGKYGVAGVLAHPGRQLKKLGRRHHFHAESLPEGGSSYWMDPDVAELFNQARDL
jgi:hypothetical protein